LSTISFVFCHAVAGSVVGCVFAGGVVLAHITGVFVSVVQVVAVGGVCIFTQGIPT